MRTRIVRDPTEARLLWDLLSPLEKPFDHWDLRACFHQPLGYDLHFIVADDESGQPIGLLPLQWNTGRGKHEAYFETTEDFLEFFGGGYPLENRAYVAGDRPDVWRALFAAIDRPARLQEIIVRDPTAISEKFVASEPDYCLSIGDYADVNDYLSKTSSSIHAGKARREIRQVEAMDLQIVENDLSDLEHVFQWSIDRFGADSSFNWEVRREAFKNMFSVTAPGLSWRLATYIVAWEKQAALILLRYHDRIYEISAVNNYRIKQLGKVTRLLEIDRAIREGCRFYDALTGDYGWKSAWHFEPSARYDWTNIG